ncbi:MAG: alpha/beta family hydrolase [Pseudobdellovibrionaceae bacterium]
MSWMNQNENGIFESRADAGRQLAERLSSLPVKERKNAILLALPRGGVPVAAEISKKLQIPYDVLIVRKIGHPRQPEYGIGAITEEGLYWMNPEAVGVSEEDASVIEFIIKSERNEVLRRAQLYRQGRSLPRLKNKIVILVDDGLATGVTARVAGQFAKTQGARKVILAIPACSAQAQERLGGEIDQLICLRPSEFLFSVGQFYRDFKQLSDEEVLSFIKRSHDQEREISIPNPTGEPLKGFLDLPPSLKGLVIFAHGSGSSRFSQRNQQVASFLNSQGIGTLLFDLLSEMESQDRRLVFQIPLLADRLIAATNWIRRQDSLAQVPLGYFGASTGAGAALWAAAELGSEISAVVSRGGRPDLALEKLSEVSAPTLLLVGDLDTAVIDLNQQALAYLPEGRLRLISGASHLFEEPGTLEEVSQQASQWFLEIWDQKKPQQRSYENDIQSLSQGGKQ